jgi:hypothetical protein
MDTQFIKNAGTNAGIAALKGRSTVEVLANGS